MLPSTWATLLDDLRAYGARRQQRRAELIASQVTTAGEVATRTEALVEVAGEMEDTSLERHPAGDAV